MPILNEHENRKLRNAFSVYQIPNGREDEFVLKWLQGSIKDWQGRIRPMKKDSDPEWPQGNKNEVEWHSEIRNESIDKVRASLENRILQQEQIRFLYSVHSRDPKNLDSAQSIMLDKIIEAVNLVSYITPAKEASVCLKMPGANFTPSNAVNARIAELSTMPLAAGYADVFEALEEIGMGLKDADSLQEFIDTNLGKLPAEYGNDTDEYEIDKWAAQMFREEDAEQSQAHDYRASIIACCHFVVCIAKGGYQDPASDSINDLCYEEAKTMAAITERATKYSPRHNKKGDSDLPPL